MAYTQDERMCQVSSPLGDNVLLLAELVAHESISQPFNFDLSLMSEKDNVDFGQLIGKPLTVHLSLNNGNERYFHGIVSRFSQGQSVNDFTSYHAEVVPFLWLLRRRTGCRIFQHKTVPDIIKTILAETGFSDYEFQLSGEHPEREYCVQFRESDLNFISRLSEEEGISYFFKHSEKAHTLVFFDSPSANAPCPGQTSCAYVGKGDTTAPGGGLRNWRMEREFATGKYALTDYNFEDPSMNLLATTTTAHAMGGNDKFEVYHYPGDYAQLSDGERLVKLRMQAEEAAAVTAHASSDCSAFTPGYRFELVGHYRSDYNGQYLITDVVHHIVQDVGDAGRYNSYSNEVACMPYSVPMRPQLRTPKPTIYGVQTATVVGASGKEIDVDSHGRVVVQFHWDREGKRDENSSCRVRVAQNWAGKGWGLVANPRIGQEVIVQFIDGDPDRPIIVGRVYNGEQTMAFGIPASDTQTGFVSRSSPGGSADNANVWRFEDKKGAEQIFVHAEKDHDVEIENDSTRTVGNNETLQVKNDRHSTIEHDEKHEVKNDRGHTVGNDESTSVGHDQTNTVGHDHSLDISNDDTLSVGGKRKHDVGKDEVISVGENQQLSVSKDRTLVVEGKQATTVSKDWTLTVSENANTTVTKAYVLKAKTVTVDVEDQILIQTGDAKIVLKKNGDISIEGGKIQVKATGDLILKGSKIQEN